MGVKVPKTSNFRQQRETGISQHPWMEFLETKATPDIDGYSSRMYQTCGSVAAVVVL